MPSTSGTTAPRPGAPARPPSRLPTPRPPSALASQTAYAAVVLSGFVAVALWLGAGGLRDLLSGPAGAWTSTGRVLGLLAADLLLVQVVLMARVPALERWWGQDRLARTHRWVGLTSFWLMLGHVAATVVGYAAAARTGLLAESWRLVVDYPGMLLALAGTAALCLVVVTSVRAARRRLRYESWHLLHLYAYLGVLLALPHQLWTGTTLTSSTAAAVYWWALYVTALGSVLVWRVGTPVYRTLLHRLRVERVVPEGDGVVSVHLTGHHLHRLPVRAGQFFLWRFLDGPGWTRANPYSLSAVPVTDRLRISVKDLGDGSGRLAHLAPGTRVLLEGPYGAVTAARRRSRKVLLLSAGVGVTTVRALLEDLPLEPGDATVVQRVRRREGSALGDELERLAAHRGARLVWAEGPRAAPRPDGTPRWVPAAWAEHVDDVEALRRLVPDLAEHDAFVCGPPDWMAAVRRALVAGGVPPDRIHSEEFAW